jgi:microcystin-dependent protein
MSDAFVAEIRAVGFNFAPTGWALCDGQILPISQNTALFSLLGTTYGGDGKSTFALPDLQGSAPMHPGQGSGLSLRDLGETGGTQAVSLLQSEFPSHTHTYQASSSDANGQTPGNNLMAETIGMGAYAVAGASTDLAPTALAPAGSDQPHNNMMPSLVLNFIIALQGVFPPRP